MEGRRRVQRTPVTVGVAGGDGLVVRFGGVIAYLDIPVGAPAESVRALLAAIESASHAQPPGAALAERLAPTVFGAGRPVACGVIARLDAGLLVLLHGAVTADIETQLGRHRLSGDDGPAWVQKVVPDPALDVAVHGSRQHGPPANPHTDLRAGVVPGGGFVMTHVDAPVTAPTPAGVVATERISAGADPGHTVQFAGTPAPTPTAAVDLRCGVLISQDGAAHPLDRPYVIGRAPLADDAVRNALASPIVVPYDPYVSRVHAYVTVADGAVFVCDASTPAGTFIAAPGAKEWTRIQASAPTRLEPGWSMRVGGWVGTFQP